MSLLQAKFCGDATVVQDFFAGLEEAQLKTLERCLRKEHQLRHDIDLREKLERQRAREVKASRRAAAAPARPAVETVADAEALVDVDAADGERRTALWRAASQGRVDVLRALVAKNADVNKAATSRKTPLYAATIGGHAACVAALVAAGADVDAGPAPPLVVACRHGALDVARELVRGGARDWAHEALDAAAERGDAPLCAYLLDSGGAPARVSEEASCDCALPLLTATRGGHRDVVEALASRGVDPHHANYEASENLTPMMGLLDPCYGVGRGSLPWAAPDEATARVLAAHGLDVNRLQGETADGPEPSDAAPWGRRAEDAGWGQRLVVWAAERDCFHRSTACVDLICGALGADVDACDQLDPSYGDDEPRRRHRSALDVACEEGHLALVERLVDAFGATVHTPRPPLATRRRRRRGRFCSADIFPAPTPVEWLLEDVKPESVPERLLALRFLVARGAVVDARVCTDYYHWNLADRGQRLKIGPDRYADMSVAALQSTVGPMVELGAALCDIMREQERARRYAILRGLSLVRAGRAAIRGDERLARGLGLLGRAGGRGASGQRFAARALEFLFDDAQLRDFVRQHELTYRAALV